MKPSMFFSEEDKRTLLQLARTAIAARIIPGEEERTIEPSDALRQQCGAFVSLYVEGNLRGCIGTFSEDETLFRNVKSMAVSAALFDSRFSPVKPEELDALKIEISILTPRIRIDDIGDIIIGKHGIYMQKGLNRGTLLPQVAVNQNWNVEEFLGNCSRHKAGLGWEGWKAADLFIYEAIVFNSEDLQEKC